MKLGKKQEKWLKALESGRYKQGNGRLRREDNTHCCLGVAYRTLRCEFTLDPNQRLYKVYGDVSVMMKPGLIGLRNSWGAIKPYLTPEEKKVYFRAEIPSRNGLTSLNDADATFKQIARFIRENPERVFTKSV